MPKEKVSMTKVGRYGMMAAQYLKENERLRYNTLYRLGRLAEKMMEVNEEANSLRVICRLIRRPELPSGDHLYIH